MTMRFGFAISLLILSSCTSNFQASSQNSGPGDGQIIGGTSVDMALRSDQIADAATVSLMYQAGGQLKSFCSGTLISKDLVLTASHCLKGIDFDRISISFDPITPEFLDAKNLGQPEKALTDTQSISADGHKLDLNDVAIIKLQKDAPEGFNPVMLLDPEFKVQPGQEILLSGYGIVSESPSLNAHRLNLVRVQVSEMTETMVTVDQSQRRGACSGDSGGPAFIEASEGLWVFGVTHGPKLGDEDCDHQAEFTYASAFKDFIISGAKQLGAKPPSFGMP